MKVEHVRVKDMLNICKLVAVEKTGSGIGDSVSQLVDDALFKFEKVDEKQSRVHVITNVKTAKSKVYGAVLEYDLDDGNVIEPGNLPTEIDRFKKYLNTFKTDDLITISCNADRVTITRAIPKKKVSFKNTVSEKDFGDETPFTNAWKYDGDKVTDKDGKELEFSRVVIAPETIANEIDVNGKVSDFANIKFKISNGTFTIKLADKTEDNVIQSMLEGTVQGEVEASYGEHITNIFSTLAKFGGESDMVIVNSYPVLLVYHEMAKFTVKYALMPVVKNED